MQYIPLILTVVMVLAILASVAGGLRYQRLTRLCLVVMGLALIASVLARVLLPSSQPSPVERDAVAGVLNAQVEAWNRGDLEGFMAGYWNSPELTFFSGSTVTHGWQGTLERYQRKYQGEGQEMGKLTFSDLEIELLGTSSALVRGHWQLLKSKETVGGLYTLLLKRFPEGWRVVHDHTS